MIKSSVPKRGVGVDLKINMRHIVAEHFSYKMRAGQR